MGAKKIWEKRLAAVRPYLEEGEQVRGMYLGQTPIPPIVYLFIGQIVFVFIVRFKTFVATDRNMYVFSNKWLRTYAFKGEPYKVPLSQARFESGSTWARVDDGPKAWCAPFGPLKRQLRELESVMAEARGQLTGPEPAPA